MSTEWDAPVVKRKRRWLRWLLGIVGSLLLLLFIGYFVATSAWCLKRLVLPRVSEAVNATITVEDASLSPFSAIVLRGLKVQSGPEAEALVTAPEVEVRYSLFDIIGGHINVSSVVLLNPVIQLIENADGTSNLDPLRQRPAPTAPLESAPRENQPLQLSLGKLEIRNATIRRIKLRPDGGHDLAEIDHFNLTLSQVGNGKSGSLNLTTGIRADQLGRGETSPGTNAVEADFSATFNFALTADLKPQSLSGDATVDVTRLPRTLREYAGVGLSLHCELTPTDLDQLSLVVKQRGRTLGKLSVRGPLELARQEGRLKLDLSGIDRNVLNLAGSKMGVDFGDTGINATNEIVLSDGGQSVAASGRLQVNRLSATRAGQVSPILDLQLGYAVNLNRADNAALLKQFTLAASQNGAPLLQAGLAKPTTIAWGAGSNAVTESAFRMAVTNLNLADWKSLLGDYAGRLNLNLDVAMNNAGRRLEAELATDLKGFSASLGTNRVTDADLKLTTKAQIDAFAKVHLSDFHGTLQHHQQLCLSLALSGDYDTRTEAADLQAQIELALPEMLALIPVPTAKITNGTLTLKARAQQKSTADKDAKPGAKPALAQNVTGDLQLKNLGATVGPLSVDQFNLSLNWDAGWQGGILQIRKLTGDLAQANRPGGRFDVSGTYDVARKSADATLDIVDLNQTVLGPMAQPSLQGKTIKSLSLGTHLALKYTPSAESSLNGRLQLANVLFDDPAGQLPKVPLSMDLKIDAGLLTNLAIMRELTVKLRVSDTPGGSLTMSGEYDLTKQAGQVNLKVAELNENAIRPFAATALGDKALKSVAISADLHADYDAAGESSLRGQFAFQNLLVIDPSGTLPNQPLAASVQIDGSLTRQIAAIRKLQLQLAPTDRANNLLSLTGQVDFAKSNALNGNLMLSSDSLDFTPYYEMFAGHRGSNIVAAVTNASPVKPPAPANPAEPPPVLLPVQHFVAGVNLNRVYLGEIAVRDWRTQISVDGSRIVVKPFDLVLNGASIRAQTDLNLGVPGYEYSLNLLSEKIPVEPLANTFAPQSRGQLKGDILADVRITGAGLTGPSLQKNLAGKFALQFTNCNVPITSPRAQSFLQPIAFLLNAPELLNSPLNGVGAAGQISAGRITVREIGVTSDTFNATTGGEIRMAEIMADSPLQEWPMHFALQRSLAERIHMVPQNTPPGTAYVNLPDFIRVGGTLGEPKPLLNKTALAGAALDKLKDNLLKDKTRLPGLSKPGVQTPSAPSLPSAPSAPSAPSTPTLKPFPLLR